MKTHTKFRNQNFMFRNSFNWDISKKWAVGSNLVFSKVYYDERKTGRTDTAGGPGAISLIHQVSDQRTDARTFTANGYFKALLNGSNHELTGVWIIRLLSGISWLTSVILCLIKKNLPEINILSIPLPAPPIL